MKITERRIIIQEWHETDDNNNGWDSNGWIFKDDRSLMTHHWTVISNLEYDKYYNPIFGIAEKETDTDF